MHQGTTSGAGSPQGEPLSGSLDRRLRRVGLGQTVAARPGRDLALVAMVVGAGAFWAWSRGLRRRTLKRRPDMPTLAAGRGLHVERTVTVRRPPEEAYRAWRDLERLPRLLPEHLVSVTSTGPGRSRWIVKGPAGVEMTWDAELTADEVGRLIAWRSAPGADVDIAGSVRFTPAPGRRGTEVKVILTYSPPGGKLGAAAATLLGQGGDRLVRKAVRRFKQLMETGEIAVGAGSRGLEPQSSPPAVARSA